MPASLRPLSTGELLDKTFTLYRQNFPLLALATYINMRKGFITQPGFYQAYQAT